jgi:hypothetical protein
MSSQLRIQFDLSSEAQINQLLNSESLPAAGRPPFFGGD